MRKILFLFILFFCFSIFLGFGGMSPGITYSRMLFETISLFIPTIIFLILFYLAEKSKSEKTKMKLAIASLVLAIVSWIGFFVYNNYFLWS